MLALGLRAVQLALAACGAYLLYLAVASLVAAAPLATVDLPRVAGPAPADPSFARYGVIGERNLFRTRDQPVVLASEEERLEESRLNLRLLGTTATDPAALSVASVEDVAKREVLSLRAGDQVSGARVVAIERRRIVLDNHGRREQLSLDDAAERRPAPRAASRSARKPPRARPPRPARAPVLRPEPAPAEALAALFGPELLDLAEGERVTALNGLDLSNPEAMERVIEIVAEGSPATFTIESASGETRQIVREAR